MPPGSAPAGKGGADNKAESFKLTPTVDMLSIESCPRVLGAKAMTC